MDPSVKCATASDAFAALGWEPKPSEDELRKQLRGTLAGALGTLGDDPEVQNVARTLYAKYKRDAASVDLGNFRDVSLLTEDIGPSGASDTWRIRISIAKGQAAVLRVERYDTPAVA